MCIISDSSMFVDSVAEVTLKGPQFNGTAFPAGMCS